MEEIQVQSQDWEDPLERKWQPTPVFLPGKSHRQRSLVDYSPLSCQRIAHELTTKHKQYLEL